MPKKNLAAKDFCTAAEIREIHIYDLTEQQLVSRTKRGLWPPYIRAGGSRGEPRWDRRQILSFLKTTYATTFPEYVAALDATDFARRATSSVGKRS